MSKLSPEYSPSWKRNLIIKIIIINIFFPLFFLIFNQEFTGYFAPGFSIPLDQRGFEPLSLNVLGLFIFFSLLASLFILWMITPIFDYLKTKEDYKDARVATLKIPWFLLILHTILWILGPLVYYMMLNFKSVNNVPFYWALLTNLSGGWVGAICTILTLNNTLTKLKALLNVTDIKENEQDYFIRFKDYIVKGTILFFIIVHLAYLCYFYFHYGLNLGDKGISFIPLLIISLFIFIISFGIYFYSRKDYRDQIKILHTKLDQMAKGSADLSNRIVLTNFDELGVLCAKINSFLDSFTGILNKVQEAGTVLLQSANNLFSSSSETASISNQQAASIKEVVATVEESDNFINDMDMKVNEVADLIKEDEEAIARGFGLIKESLHNMDDIKESNQKIIQGIKSLSSHIDSIWDIVRIINSIADQTKIIAFNAELEASAAGEAGKNFQIVASEIRRLADKTVSSTKEIKSKIDEIQKSSDFLVSSSEKGTVKIKEEWELSNNIGQIFDNIHQSTEISAESAMQIIHGISRVVSASNQILITLRQINEGIINFVEATQFTTTSAEELKTTADSLNTVIENYTDT